MKSSSRQTLEKNPFSPSFCQVYYCPYFRDALTSDTVESGCGPYRITAKSATGKLQELLQAARQAKCEDCAKLITDCACEWSQKEISAEPSFKR